MEKTKNILIKTLFICFILYSIGMLAAQVVRAEPAGIKSAGTITFVSGDANIIHADKTSVKAAKNDALNAGDAIETKNGRLQLSLIDGGKVSLQPNTVYKINKYEFSGKEDGSEYAFTELLKGGLRTVSGLIGHKNRERYQLKTAVATIGIRGTEFTVNFNDNQLLMTTNHGSVDVCNAGGCLNAVTGQTISVAGLGAAPKSSGKAARASAAPPASSKVVFTAADLATNTVIAAEVVSPARALANYSGPGFVSTVMKTVNGNGVDGVLTVDLITNASSQPIDVYTSGNSIDIHPTSFASYNSDGLIAWGRAAGTLDVAGGNGNGNGNNGNGNGNAGATSDTMEWMDYAVGARPDPAQLANLTGTYNVFGSTAPMLLSGGISTTVGAENAVTGSFTFNFVSTNYNYNLNVQTVGANYGLTGSESALSAANPTFQTGGTVTGLVCVTACSAALQGGASLIQGAFFGTNGERIGLQYGFNAPVGQIFGTAVLK